MVSHMQTTVQIPDSLFEEARMVANRERTTLKALIEERLRRIVSQHKRPNGFRLRKATFKRITAVRCRRFLGPDSRAWLRGTGRMIAVHSNLFGLRIPGRFPLARFRL